MSYRERFAWLSLATMAGGYGPYFAYVAWTRPAPDVPNLGLLALFAAATGVRLAILGPGWTWLWLRTPRDDRMMDERDRDIDHRATVSAYYVMMVGLMLSAVIKPFSAWGWDIVNAALGAVVVAEAVRYGLTVWGYRQTS